MKRKGNLYEKICSLENLILAEKKARKGKSNQKEVRAFDFKRDQMLLNLNELLNKDSYKTSKYQIFKIFEGKERVIYKLPYFPDRIVHHAIMNILEPIFVDCFTKDTYSCIKKRGIHKALKVLNKNLKDEENTKYCLKLDIKKFYPNVDHEILKSLLRKKIKDEKLLIILDEIIDSAEGIPIGNYLSQYFGNFYLTYFDHWLKEVVKVKYYFRYCDDLVILHDNKEFLHELRIKIQEYLRINLKLELKSNYQVFPVAKRGIDFVGYKFYHTHVLLRKSIKNRFVKMIKFRNNIKSITSYNGWCKHGNCKNLWNKYVTI